MYKVTTSSRSRCRRSSRRRSLSSSLSSRCRLLSLSLSLSSSLWRRRRSSSSSGCRRRRSSSRSCEACEVQKAVQKQGVQNGLEDVDRVTLVLRRSFKSLTIDPPIDPPGKKQLFLIFSNNIVYTKKVFSF